MSEPSTRPSNIIEKRIERRPCADLSQRFVSKTSLSLRFSTPKPHQHMINVRICFMVFPAYPKLLNSVLCCAAPVRAQAINQFLFLCSKKQTTPDSCPSPLSAVPSISKLFSEEFGVSSRYVEITKSMANESKCGSQGQMLPRFLPLGAICDRTQQ
jgi:hypothetical protein